MHVTESFIVQKSKCRHLNLSIEIESSIVDSCPKGCDGEHMIDAVLKCNDCHVVLHKIAAGHEGCKYGR